MFARASIILESFSKNDSAISENEIKENIGMLLLSMFNWGERALEQKHNIWRRDGPALGDVPFAISLKIHPHLAEL